MVAVVQQGGYILKRVRAADRLIYVLAQGIAAGRWKPGDTLPTVRDLARETGISTPTTAKAIRLAAESGLVALHANRPATVLPDAPRIAAGMLDLPAAAPETPASSPGRTRIALLFPDVDWPLRNPPLVSLRQHLNTHAAKVGMDIELMPWPIKDQLNFALSLAARGYAGAICLGMRAFYQAGLLALATHRFPTLLVNRRYPHVPLPTITGDNYRPAYDLALRLARLGHRSVSLVADLLPNIEMEVPGVIRGWVDGLVEADLLHQCPIPVYITPHLDALMTSPRTFEQLLLRSDRPTALFFYWPVWSSVILTDPRFAEFRIPDDVSVIVAMAGERPLALPGAPPLATLDYDYDRMASCAIQMITDLIAGKPHSELLQLPLRLNLTESVGPPPKA
jgi:DNA-binding LacI/PurR family transcriptional regulator